MPICNREFENFWKHTIFLFKSNLAPHQFLFRNLDFHPGWSVFLFQLLTKFSSEKQIFIFSCFSCTCILFFFSTLLRCNWGIMSALLRYNCIFKVFMYLYIVKWLFLSINTSITSSYFYVFIVLACVMVTLQIYALSNFKCTILYY